MKSLCVSGAVLAAVLACISTVPVAAETTTAAPAAHDLSQFASMRALLVSGNSKLQAHDWAGAETDLKAAIANPFFAGLSPKIRYGVYYGVAQLQVAARDYSQAYQNLLTAGTVAPELRDSAYWAILTKAAGAAGEKTAAADALTNLIVGDPSLLSKGGDRADYLVRSVVIGVHPVTDNGDRELKLLEAMWAIHYVPNNPFWTDEQHWFHLFELYVARNQDAKAREVLAALREPVSVIKLHADRRYMAYAPYGPYKGNYADAIAAYVADARTLAAAHPDKLEGQLLIANRLTVTNHPELALSVLDAARTRINQAPAGKPAFDDVARQLNWLLDQRARALRHIETSDHVVDEKAVAAAREEARVASDRSGSDPISQHVNLADTYYQTGRSQEAIDTLAEVDVTRASPYGRMAVLEARACAYAGLNDLSKTAEILADMKTHRDDSPMLLREAMLCNNDLDGVAAMMIADLDNPTTRNLTLVQLQEYQRTHEETAFLDKQDERDNAVRARPDVQAAIARYGTIQSYPSFEWAEQ